MASKSPLIPAERIERSILLFRGHKVMLDSDLAALYGTETKQLVRAVKRNYARFPPQTFVSAYAKRIYGFEVPIWHLKVNIGPRGGRRTPPWAFSEQGVAMLSSVLHSDRAVAVNIEIMRPFRPVETDAVVARRPARRLDELEQKYDKQFSVVFDAIRQLMTPPEPAARKSATTRSCKVLGNLLSLCLQKSQPTRRRMEARGLEFIDGQERNKFPFNDNQGRCGRDFIPRAVWTDFASILTECVKDART